MPQFRFRGSFRDYQNRVLQRADELMQDQHLHVVAAPGSGKTILGLEMISRLASPALVLTPTLAIRDQWIQRFITNFAPADDQDGPTPTDLEELTSTDLLSAKFLTVVTYQTLWAAMNHQRDEETNADFTAVEAPLPQALVTSGIRTICLDEAHHLRRSWQQSLTDFLAQLQTLQGPQPAQPLRFLALTATPPYDSTPEQWQRYLDTCGPIDEEISIPELVSTADLCPHQDYVYLTVPTKDETDALNKLTSPYLAAFNALYATGTLQRLVEELARAVMTADENVQICLDSEDTFLSFLQITARSGTAVPAALENVSYASFAGRATAVTGVENAAMGFHQAAAFILDHPQLFTPATWDQAIEILTSQHLLRRHNDALMLATSPSDKCQRLLNQSLSKFPAIVDIVRSEISTLGEQLRLVVLTDHIHADALAPLATGTPPSRLGAVPILSALQHELANDLPEWREKLAVLTGTLVIVPTTVVDTILTTGEKLFGKQWKAPTVKPVTDGFMRLDFPAATSQSVPTLTATFTAGEIQILIGTTALLGEGWDAPALNSLVIASSVKTFMLSNQIRGRAIRIDPDQPDKVANIWHLLTLEQPPVEGVRKIFAGDDGASQYGALSMQRRMRTNTGLVLSTLPKIDTTHAGATGPGKTAHDTGTTDLTSFESASACEHAQLDSGLERCFRVPLPQALQHPAKVNAETLAYSRQRHLIAEGWRQALREGIPDTGYGAHLRVETQMDSPKATLFNLVDLIIVACLVAVFFLSQFVLPTRYARNGLMLLAQLVILVTFVIAWAILWWARRNLYWFKRRHRLQARAILNALQDVGAVTSPAARISVETGEIGATVQLENATLAEEIIFAQAIEEVSLPPRNPRYLVVPKYRLGIALPVFAQAVPNVFSRNRQSVENYVQALNQAGMALKAVYARNSEGRAILVKARRFALSHLIKGMVKTHRW